MIQAFEGSIVTIPAAEPVEIVMVARRCWKCRETKTLTDFRPDRRRKFGRKYVCRTCDKISVATKAAP